MSNIKQKLKSAYENVEFFANSSWTCYAKSYQKANQELFSREQKIQEKLSEQKLHPRTVQDCIPQSRLAQYCNFEYNDAREISYASSVSDINFYYPCIYKRGSCVEPWMLPETEQLFVWFAHAQNFDSVDPAIFEVNHKEEAEKDADKNDDFHKINAVLYDSVEKTPGEFRYTSAKPLTEEDLAKYEPSPLKVDTFEEMILKMQIGSEKVKRLWRENENTSKNNKSHESCASKKKMNIFKSPLGNFILFGENANRTYLAEENSKINIEQEISDVHELKLLTEGIKSLQHVVEEKNYHLINTNLMPMENVSIEEINSGVPEKQMSLPTRRLYSAVVQGLYYDNHPQNRVEIIPLNHNASKKPTLHHKDSSTTFATNESNSVRDFLSIEISAESDSIKQRFPKNSPISPPAPPSNWLNQNDKNITEQNNKHRCVNLVNSELKLTQLPIPTEKPKEVEENNIYDFSRSNFAKISPNRSQQDNPKSDFSDWNFYNLVKESENQCNASNKNVNSNSCFSAYGYIESNAALSSINNSNARTTTSFNDMSYPNQALFNVSNNNLCGYPLIENNLPVNNGSNQNTLTRNAIPQLIRQNYCLSNQPQSTWIAQRIPHICNIPQYQNHPYLFVNPPSYRSTPRLNQNQQFLRSSQTYHPVLLNSQQATSNWNSQMCTLCRGHSIPKPSSPPVQFYDNPNAFQNTRTKYKQKKFFSESPRNWACYNVDNSNDNKAQKTLWDGKHLDHYGNSVSEKGSLIKTVVSNSILERNFKVSKMDEDVQKSMSTVNVNLHEVESRTTLPVSKSISEELEKLALEQYHRSSINLIKNTESFYQDMERLAKEQYEGAPENWMSPPNCDMFFGGHDALDRCDFMFENQIICSFQSLIV